MAFVMILLDRMGLLQKQSGTASRFDERLIRTCQREQMLDKGHHSPIRTPVERQAA